MRKRSQSIRCHHRFLPACVKRLNVPKSKEPGRVGDRVLTGGKVKRLKKNKSVLLWIRGKIQPRCSAQEAADRLRREEGSRFGCPGDASAKEKSVVWQPVLTEASNKTILGQSCHTRRHARLQIIQSTLTWHLIHCSKPGEKQNHTARR